MLGCAGRGRFQRYSSVSQINEMTTNKLDNLPRSHMFRYCRPSTPSYDPGERGTNSNYPGSTPTPDNETLEAYHRSKRIRKECFRGHLDIRGVAVWLGIGDQELKMYQMIMATHEAPMPAARFTFGRRILRLFTSLQPHTAEL